MPELRIDPIVGHKVLIAEKRAGRPNDFASADAAESPDASSCPFCAGNERETPGSLLEAPDGKGGWQVRVVPNKFPAVSCDFSKEPEETGLPFLSSRPAYGAHEVIVESPQHIRDINDLAVSQLAGVLRVYRDRLLHWSSDGRVRHATVFKNVGYAAGATLEHIHGQLVALPFVPTIIEAELQGAEHYYDQWGACVFCRLLREEFVQQERLVAENDAFVAICAYAARQPYEIWIFPKTHDSRYERLTDGNAGQLADILQRVVGQLRKVLTPLSYNLLLHTAPFGGRGADCYHWHMELIPRTNQLAGLEWGAGVYVNPLSPERAAERLRQAES